VDTQGLVIGARLHSAQIQEREGIKLFLDIAARDRLPKYLYHLWLEAGYTGEQKGAGCRRIPGCGEKLQHSRQLHWQHMF
jgi:hypothetical protein